jgi:alpha-beta hydrolase superfamily lysophospholipase
MQIATYEWTDLVEVPRGAVQIAHGLGEHAGRYARFAAALNAAGFQVYATDHRGHGRTSSESLGNFGDAGFAGLIADVAHFGAQIAGEHPELPVFLFGHSMGSFAAQAVIVEHSQPYAGVVLSGSSALDVLAASAANADGPGGLKAFNTGFEHRTGYEWLSRDEVEVDLYMADEWCGFDLLPNSAPSLFEPAGRLADPTVLGLIRNDFPILITSGSADPLAADGQLVQLLGQRYRDVGVADVTVTVYSGARHEILNETNRDEVTADIVSWLSR